MDKTLTDDEQLSAAQLIEETEEQETETPEPEDQPDAEEQEEEEKEEQGDELLEEIEAGEEKEEQQPEKPLEERLKEIEAKYGPKEPTQEDELAQMEAAIQQDQNFINNFNVEHDLQTDGIYSYNGTPVHRLNEAQLNEYLTRLMDPQGS